MKGCFGKVLMVFLLGGALLLTGGYLWTKSYLRSDEFMTLLKYGVSKKLGGHVELAETHWDGWTLENDEIEVLAGKGFQDLEVERISVEIDPRGFVDRVWRVSDVHIRALSLHLGDPLRVVEPYDAGGFPIELDWKDVGKAWLPRRAEVENVLVERCDGSFLSEGVSGHWENAGIQADRDGQDYRFTLPKGDIYLSSFPEIEWKVDVFKGRLKPASFFINDARLVGAGEAVLSFNGEGAYKGRKVFQGEIQDFPLREALQEDWKKRVNGELQGDFTVESGAAGLKGHGKAWVENGAVTAFPILDTLAKQTGVSRFRHIILDTCSANYEFKEGIITLRDIEVLSKGFLKVNGQLETSGSTGGGSLQLGLHSSVMEKMPKGVESIFKKEAEGYYWSTVILKQESGEWEEDLSSRILSAAVKAFFSNSAEVKDSVLSEVQRFLGNESDQDEDREEASSPQDVIKKSSDLIETGVKSLFDLLGK